MGACMLSLDARLYINNIIWRSKRDLRSGVLIGQMERGGLIGQECVPLNAYAINSTHAKKSEAPTQLFVDQL